MQADAGQGKIARALGTEIEIACFVQEDVGAAHHDFTACQPVDFMHPRLGVCVRQAQPITISPLANPAFFTGDAPQSSLRLHLGA